MPTARWVTDATKKTRLNMSEGQGVPSDLSVTNGIMGNGHITWEQVE